MKKHNELKPPTPSEQFKNDRQEPSSTPKALRTCPKSLAITIPTGCDRIALPTFTKGKNKNKVNFARAAQILKQKNAPYPCDSCKTANPASKALGGSRAGQTRVLVRMRLLIKFTSSSDHVLNIIKTRLPQNQSVLKTLPTCSQHVLRSMTTG
ncbi:hypothetical protein BU23DRAFT_25288 [Bimuria novae-zelandiae CBS 107.79]|uniref:Uncharacterized protein n=1 Tax=Bimuria novae-zelandiae CBS 107.79 TaxID=1447943 RepID=A0A6A5UKW8_9PLEO|nr:hypothetical protein BU23DRAFT_25288 [Bimuria novae-zelandiae CBS 107.79]